MKITEKAAYLKGLCDGLKPDANKAEGKLILELIETVSLMAAKIEEMEADAKNLRDYVEELDEDLGSVEELLYDEEDEDDFDDDFECDGNCCDCDSDCELADEEFFEVECPACGEVICFDGSIDPEELACPACGEKFECIIAEEDLKALDGEE